MKPRKNKLPRLSYSLMDELMANAVQPLTEQKQRTYLSRVRRAYDEMCGEEPSYAAADLCIDVIGMVEALVTLGIAEDGSGLIHDAQVALGYAVRMYPEGPAQPLTPEGAHSVQSVIDDYAEMMAVLPARTMIHCHRNAEKQRKNLITTTLTQRKQHV